MMKLICLLFVLAAVHASSVHNINRKLVKLSVVFRHGDRMPILKDVPVDSYKEIKLDLPPESLTKAGAERSKKLGAMLRKQYKSFLNTYVPKEVDVYSSPIQRCKDTFTNMSRTLYPLKPNQDIPYFSPSVQDDNLIATFYSCPKIFDRNEYIIENPEDIEFFKKLSVHIGKEITSYRDAVGLQDYFKVMNEVGYGMPEWAAENWEGFNMQYLNFWKSLASKHGEMGGGNLLYKIAKDSASAKLIKNPKVHLYSGHDYNVIILLHLLESFHFDKINYCSYIAFEVYKPLIGPHYVEVYFDNNDDTGRQQLKIPGCNYRCSVAQFLKFAEQFYKGDKWCT